MRPGSTDEVARVLAACNRAAIGVVPQGGNTGMVGGGVPRAGEVVISTTRLRDLEPVDDAGEVTVGAGVTLASVQAHVRAAGWDIGIDFGSRDSATIGGMVATNAGGIRVLRYGPMRGQLRGLEAILADGRIVRRLPGLVKDNTGLHLPSLLAGSEGTLAVVTRVRLALVPQIQRSAVALIGLPSLREAAALGNRLRRRLATLMAAEAFTTDGLKLVIEHLHAQAPFTTFHGAYLLVECAAARDPLDDLEQSLAEEGPTDVVAGEDEGTRRRLWRLREGLTEAIAFAGIPHKLDVAVPIGRIGDLAEQVPELVTSLSPAARCVIYGHVGDGNLHINVLGLPPDDEAVDDAILRLTIALGGSISAEHGVGVAKARWLEADRGPVAVAMTRAIKAALDPKGILNPGVILPLRPGAPGRR
ncbi:MAG TPA: FAD-binding oxidoreductase [Candidatus Limnocylindria bacterium]|nr:FAD-binding oxidoreductase [Candidatus Limnocylindria bacterium]